ncbi:hypothetical protein GMI70_02915 [Eggerthellaceae bacterium zg-893]|nr:hypothetical protein [Eggerthellaceae bacterium zg-893]
MNAMDDPSVAWDAHCDAREREYAALIDGKTCGDCGECEAAPDGKSAYGWCLRHEWWVLLEERVEDVECETFAA